MGLERYVINPREGFPALIGEFNERQQAELEVVKSFDPARIGSIGLVRVANYKSDCVEFPLKPGEVKGYTFAFLSDTYEMRGGEFQRISNPTPIDELVQLVEQRTSGRARPPIVKQIAAGTVWETGPVNLEIAISGEINPAQLAYRVGTAELLKIGASIRTINNGFLDFIVSDETGNYQKPDMKLIESKLVQAAEKAKNVDYNTRHFYAEGKCREFNSPELNAALNLASRMFIEIDLSKRIKDIREIHAAAWREKVIAQLPEITEDLYELVSRNIQGVDQIKDYEQGINNFFDFALTCDLYKTPALQKRISELVILRERDKKGNVSGQERVIKNEVQEYEDKLAKARLEQEKFKVKKPFVLREINAQANGLLGRLGLNKQERKLLRKNTHPLHIEVPVDDDDEVPF